MTLWRNALVRMRPQLLLRSEGILFSRSMASKDHVPSPKCTKKEGDCGSINYCGNKSLKHKPKSGEDEFQFHHLLKMPPECCGDPCLEVGFPTFDECLYKESDKAKRKYQVTWVECPPMQIKPKKICCFEKGKRPPIVRRKRKAIAAECVDQAVCPEDEGDCPKFKLPGCRPVRTPTRCHRARTPTDCVKVKAPYPAFSECRRRKPGPLRKVECQCLSLPSICDVLDYRGGHDNCGGSKK